MNQLVTSPTKSPFHAASHDSEVCTASTPTRLSRGRQDDRRNLTIARSRQAASGRTAPIVPDRQSQRHSETGRNAVGDWSPAPAAEQRSTAGHSGTAVPRPPGTGGSRPDHTSSEANSVRVLRFPSSIPSMINSVRECTLHPIPYMVVYSV